MHIRYVYIYMQNDAKWTQLLHSTINSSLNSTPRSKCFCLKVRTWQCYMSFYYSIHLSQCGVSWALPRAGPLSAALSLMPENVWIINAGSLNTVSHSRDVWLIPVLSSASYCCSSHRLSEVLPETQSRINQNTATVSICSSVDQRPVMSPSFCNLSPHFCCCTRNTWPSMQHDLWPVFVLSNDTPPVKSLMKPVGLSLSFLTFAEVIGGQRESTLTVFVVMQ